MTFIFESWVFNKLSSKQPFAGAFLFIDCMAEDNRQVKCCLCLTPDTRAWWDNNK